MKKAQHDVNFFATAVKKAAKATKEKPAAPARPKPKKKDK